MPLIDASYFVGELNIPGTDRPEVSEQLTWFITKYEPELLLAMLGYELYKAYKAGIEAVEPEQKWKDLRDGKEYTDSCNRLRKWEGLVSANGTYKRSPIANYVYYWWMRANATSTTGVGEAQPNTDNAARVSPAMKMCRAWNEISACVLELQRFMNNHLVVYPEWLSHDAPSMLYEFKPINPFNF